MVDIDLIIKQYTDERQTTYRLFASKIQELIVAILKNNGISHHSITYREKDPEKLREKISRPGKNYVTPLEEITDLAGVRVITYFPSDVDKIASFLEREFFVDNKNSIDKRKVPDPTKFGYASLHLVVGFTDQRLELLEYSQFKDMKCEIQVRTILQHAWAEIEHDTVYKATEDIPFELRRRFASLAGLLEVADREFESIKAVEIKVINGIKINIEDKILDIPIDLESLRLYMETYHTKYLNPNSLRGLNHLLHIHNVKTIADFNKILSPAALAATEKEIVKIVGDKCSGEDLKECDLKYFLALAEYLGIQYKEVIIFSECPVLGYGRKAYPRKINKK